MKRYAKITPEGTKDSLFAECAAQAAVQGKLTQVFESYGYAPVMTPHLEFQDVFLRQSADWLAERLYHATDSTGHLLVLRPDNTLPIARVAATRLREAAFPLRLYTHQSVFRRSRFYSGRNDEIRQSGVELLGAQGLRADLEILLCAVDALRACESPRFRLELGHAGVFRSLADALQPDEDTRAALVRCIETKNYPALEALLAPLGGSDEAEALRQLPRLFGGAEVLAKAEKLFRGTQAGAALLYLQRLYAALQALDLQDVIDIDLGLVHGQDYYTGFVFRGYMEGSGVTLLSGGRYDGLLAEFGRPAAAVGFAVGSEPLAEALLESGKVPAQPAPDVLIFAPAGLEATALAHMAQRRGEGLRCELAMVETMEEARQYARRCGIAKIAVVAGEDIMEDVEVRA
ncbi:MAG: ATP phosphoribosyltransferase regulatory subunit [Oscillospiraceae bacterium]|jgi:ATP phosphoribosyltransferase regulatory subunit|nr:ATP phosphoribosyltransferase regulatory subunit [Oscillospiraceae bacterium]